MMPDNPQDSLSAALTPASKPRSFPVIQPALALSIVALLIAAGFGFYQYQSVETLKNEIGRDLAANGKLRQELLAQQTGTLTRQQQLEARFALIEVRQSESHHQQEALSGMYDTLTRSDTVRTLAEIEQTLTFASQQLQLTGNVTAAQAMLANVDQKLAQLNRPELINVRQALAKDIDTLKALPAFDLAGITVKLDNIAVSLDKLPLAIDSYREPAVAAPKTEGDRLTRFAAEVWHEMKQLIQIRRMDAPDAQLLSPQQAFFVRENIKMRLMDARTALLLRDEHTYRADLSAALAYLNQYFDTRAPLVARNSVLIQQFLLQPLSLKMPDLGASLAAARNARAVAERVKP